MKNSDKTGAETTIRCMLCGAVIGTYGQGSFGTTKCPKCREDFRLDYKEADPSLKWITRRAKAGSAT